VRFPTAATTMPVLLPPSAVAVLPMWRRGATRSLRRCVQRGGAVPRGHDGAAPTLPALRGCAAGPEDGATNVESSRAWQRSCKPASVLQARIASWKDGRRCRCYTMGQDQNGRRFGCFCEAAAERCFK
jgi:hypothetical protein